MTIVQNRVFVTLGILVFIFLSGYVGLKLTIENLKSKRARQQDMHTALMNTRSKYAVIEQKLTEEPEIVPYAIAALGMVRESTYVFKLQVSNDDINRINERMGAGFEQ